ncbi:Meiotically up-regulated gene 65 protein [Cladobotryum mycophilum]|uniref:Meiotically up-regulated gene 65 protein n=1 Tax=Cladobotryum mycophilum TaxID=491253 RepID=A0ABR0SKS6_9HYPO
MVKVRGSRRAAPLQHSDYDHEIILIDGEDEPARPVSSEGADLVTANTSTHLLSIEGDGEEEEEEEGEGQPCDDELQQDHTRSRGLTERENGHAAQNRRSPPEPEWPSIEVQAPTPGTVVEHDENGPAYHIMPKRRKKKRETAIDILYENERGGFLCGIALFSGAALGGLDPTPWTNGYHKASPTNIHTAQCPDPSWEWVWPEWRIYRQEGTEEDGWEYSFHFSKKFSWHGPKWYSSFVRRRAWIRRRARKRPEDISSDYHVLNTDYFSVRAASDREPRSPGSVSSSHPSKHSFMHASGTDAEEEKSIIEDIDMLLHVLRLARIDREKWEAVENYLEHAIDLAALQYEMHEIMSLFVFQASRRQLLSYFMRKHEETVQSLEKEETLELKLHREALDAAIKHAEEEVRRLAYWSDVKQMAENGELLTPENWHDAWQGLDKSSPGPPGNGNGKMPQR